MINAKRKTVSIFKVSKRMEIVNKALIEKGAIKINFKSDIWTMMHAKMKKESISKVLKRAEIINKGTY